MRERPVAAGGVKIVSGHASPFPSAGYWSKSSVVKARGLRPDARVEKADDGIRSWRRGWSCGVDLDGRLLQEVPGPGRMQLVYWVGEDRDDARPPPERGGLVLGQPRGKP